MSNIHKHIVKMTSSMGYVCAHNLRALQDGTVIVKIYDKPYYDNCSELIGIKKKEHPGRVLIDEFQISFRKGDIFKLDNEFIREGNIFSLVHEPEGSNPVVLGSFLYNTTQKAFEFLKNKNLKGDLHPILQLLMPEAPEKPVWEVDHNKSYTYFHDRPCLFVAKLSDELKSVLGKNGRVLTKELVGADGFEFELITDQEGVLESYKESCGVIDR